MKLTSYALLLAAASTDVVSAQTAPKPPIEITTSMAIDVDGAPNAYGPKGTPALDNELNAHEGGTAEGAIVGYITKKDGHTPEVQGPGDPFPGYFISTTGFYDRENKNRLDPKRYVDASKVNYVVLGTAAKSGGVALGDFVAVYSKTTNKSVYGIVGDSGNSSGAEGSLALLQALGYKAKSGRTGAVEQKEIVIRYFPGSNAGHHFYATQDQIDTQAAAMGLNKAFPSQ